jgi:hypothetical protein
MVRVNQPIESPVILDLLYGIEGLDACIPVFIVLRTIHGPEGIDNVTTMGDGVPDKQEPIDTRGFRYSIVVCERSKGRVGTTTEHRSEAEAGIDNEGRVPIGCALSELGEFVSSTKSSIWGLEPVKYLDTYYQESAAQTSDQEVHE